MTLTVRQRLTLIYGSMFFIAGFALLTLNYVLVARNLPPEARFRAVAELPAPGEPPIGSETDYLVAPNQVVRIQQAVDDFRNETLSQLVTQSAIALAVVGVVAVGLGYIVAGRVLRPVHEITAAAKRLSEQNLHERLNLPGPKDELVELADTFDAMLARLDAAFDAQGRFAANAAHELRTPLAVLRTELEVAMRDPTTSREALLEMSDRLHGVVRRTENLIESLLTLAHGSRVPQSAEPVDLADVAGDAIAQCSAELSALDVRTSLLPAPTIGDPDLLAHVAGNLVANAARYNRTGGWVEVQTSSDADGRAVLSVANSGDVVPAGAVAGLFEPFQRLGADRTRSSSSTGAGLGLSIVRAIVESHGGTVVLMPLDGGGLRATVTL